MAGTPNDLPIEIRPSEGVHLDFLLNQLDLLGQLALSGAPLYFNNNPTSGLRDGKPVAFHTLLVCVDDRDFTEALRAQKAQPAS